MLDMVFLVLSALTFGQVFFFLHFFLTAHKTNLTA